MPLELIHRPSIVHCDCEWCRQLVCSEHYNTVSYMQLPPKIQIMAILACIFGAFVIYNFLQDIFRGTSDRHFNIACTDGPLNRTQELTGRFNVLLQEKELALTIAHQYPSVVTNLSHFQHKSTQLAANFEAYLRQLARVQDQMRDNMELMLAVKQAGKEFEECKGVVGRSFSESQCLGNWQEYEQCIDRAQNLRKDVQRVRNAETQTKTQIDLYIRRPNNSEPSIRIAQRLYNDSIRNNDKTRQQLVDKLDHYEKTRKTKSFLKETSVSKLIEVEKPFRECQENRKEYRRCEEISKSINTLDYGSIDLLKERIEYKKNMLARLLLVLGKPEDSKSMELLNDEYRRHVEEYKKMLRTLIEATHEIKKACGCTEEYEKRLTREVRKTEEEIVTLQREISKLEQIIIETEKEIEQNEREREDIIAEYKKSVNESEILGPEHLESELIKLKRRLENSNRELLKFEDKFMKTQQECEAVKGRMAARVTEVDEVGECLRKKEYFQKLKIKVYGYLQPQSKEDPLKDTRQQLAHVLRSFEL